MSKFNVNWKENGKLKLLIIVGTRPEIIRGDHPPGSGDQEVQEIF